MLIKTKKEVVDSIDKNLPGYPLTQRYFGKAIKRILATEKSLKSVLEVPLIKYLATNSKTFAIFENYLRERSFTNIGTPLSRLKSNLDEYYAVLAEVHAAYLLNGEGMKDVKFLSQSKPNPDIEFKENGIIKYAEVKDLMSLNPEFPILHDKFEARSLIDPLFKRGFTISCSYDITQFNSVEKLHQALRVAVEELILRLEPILRKGNMEDWTIEINSFYFRVTTHSSKHVDFVLLFSGGGGFFGGPRDVFLELSTVYTRFISVFKEGYLQLLRKREGNRDVVKGDRMYIFLNVEKNAFLGKEIKKIFKSLAKVLGMNEMVQLRIII